MNYSAEIRKTITHLQNGDTILYPTDTIWGLGCDARNEEAISKIVELKKRSISKSFVILLDNEMKLPSYVEEVPEVAWDLIEFAESPLTIILPNAKNIAKNAINEDGSIGIRIVKKGFAHELIKNFKFPIISTSINLSGSAPAITKNDIEDYFLENAGYCCDIEGEIGTGNPSSIIKLEKNGTFKFIRK